MHTLDLQVIISFSLFWKKFMSRFEKNLCRASRYFEKNLCRASKSFSSSNFSTNKTALPYNVVFRVLGSSTVAKCRHALDYLTRWLISKINLQELPCAFFVFCTRVEMASSDWLKLCIRYAAYFPGFSFTDVYTTMSWRINRKIIDISRAIYGMSQT